MYLHSPMTALRSPAARLRATLNPGSRFRHILPRAAGVTHSHSDRVVGTAPLLLLLRGHLRPFTAQSLALAKEGSQDPSPKRAKRNFSPSPEQQRIAQLCAENNVVVSARPGSGKTATAEAIVAAHPDKRVIVLTYSKRLQVETKRRLKSHANCEVLTFHALAGRLFQTVINNDSKLAKQRAMALESGQLPRWKDEPFDIVVLDEFQDCTPQIFWLVNCFIRASNAIKGQPARLIVLGDERQSIYEFRGADQRFLTGAPDLLGPISPYPFANVPLSQSFRLSTESVRFINDAFLKGEPYIKSSKPGPRPLVLRCNVKQTDSFIGDLHELIKQYGPKNSAIIAPAIRSQGLTPLKLAVNKLSRTFHVPIAVSLNDEAPLSDRVIRGKLCVSTIHQFKGSERDLIILFGMDSSYFRYFGRDLPDDKCPNEIFVALTRAGKQIVLIHDEAERPMPFVSIEALKATADIRKMKGVEGDMAPPAKPTQESNTTCLALPRAVAVRDMTRHIQDDLLDGIVSRHLCIEKLSEALPKDEQIDIPNVVSSDAKRGFYEDVSDINGSAIVAAFEHLITGRIKMLSCVTEGREGIPDVDSDEYPSWLSKRACDYEALSSGYLPRKIQMRHHKFDWISPEDLARARHRLRDEVLGSGETAILRFEEDCEHELLHPLAEKGFDGDDKGAVRICGRADIVKVSAGPEKHIDTVWEIKFVSELSHQHALQACAYAYLLGIKSGRAPRIVLFNVKNGEKWEITPKDGLDGLRLVVEETLTAKYTVHERIKDEEFLEMCAGIRQEVQDLK